jgi:hypothetical protein
MGQHGIGRRRSLLKLPIAVGYLFGERGERNPTQTFWSRLNPSFAGIFLRLLTVYVVRLSSHLDH